MRLAAWLKKRGLGNATMTPLLKRMEQKELVERQQVVGNERQKKVVLTETGRTLSQKSIGITNEVFCATGLSKQQAEEIIALCRQITAGE